MVTVVDIKIIKQFQPATRQTSENHIESLSHQKEILSRNQVTRVRSSELLHHLAIPV
jgi:hypothetical protein